MIHNLATIGKGENEMVFSSNEFIFGFLPIMLILYFNPLAKSLKYRNIVLLLMSIAFYAWGEPIFVFVMIFFSFINWVLSLWMERKREYQKGIVALAVVLDLSLLGIFKYLTFVTENLALLSGNDSLILDIALPIGISFYTFQMMSYVFDVASEKAKAQKKFSGLLMYIAMFPQLIAGPIVRYETIATEIDDRKTSIDDFSIGICRFVKGLAKKVIIANNVALLADAIFIYDTSKLSVATAWLGALAYTLQIYFDFSGYSDMAIGLGRIFGFHFLENFEHPYRSQSITEFWRRWHISMGTWFRDYVYFPLGGSRVKSKYRMIFNLFVVWILTGLWHGANWTFLLWGFMYFLLLTIEKLINLPQKMKWFGYVWTMAFVMIGWVIFRSDTISLSLGYIGVMLGNSAKGFIDSNVVSLMSQYWMVLIIAVSFSVFHFDKWRNRIPKKAFCVGYVLLYYLMIFLSICAVVKGGNNPFIYFNF